MRQPTFTTMYQPFFCRMCDCSCWLACSSKLAIVGLFLLGGLVGGCIGDQKAYVGPRPFVPAKNQNNYPAAAVFAAEAVGGAAIHRARTNQCWATCQNGTVCDEASGLCLADCEGPCSAGQKCQTIHGVRKCSAIVKDGGLGDEWGAPDASSDANTSDVRVLHWNGGE